MLDELATNIPIILKYFVPGAIILFTMSFLDQRELTLNYKEIFMAFVISYFIDVISNISIFANLSEGLLKENLTLVIAIVLSFIFFISDKNKVIRKSIDW